MQEEIARRRTFAIISHPDAGKTTLTEKLLLFGGQIQVAGAVKSNKIKKTTASETGSSRARKCAGALDSTTRPQRRTKRPIIRERASVPGCL